MRGRHSRARAYPSALTVDADRYFALSVLSEYNIYGIFIYYIYYVYLIINMNFYFNYFLFVGREGIFNCQRQRQHVKCVV